MARAVDAALAGTGSTTAVGWFIATALVAVVADTFTGLAQAHCANRSTTWLRHRSLRHVLALGVRGAQRFPAGDAVSRLVGSAAEAGSAGLTLVQLALAVCTSVGAGAALAMLHGRLAVVFAASLPLALLLPRTYLRQTAEHVTTYQRVAGELSARLLEAMQGLRTIAASRTAEQEARRVLRPLPTLAAAGHALWTAQSRMVWKSSLLGPTVQLAVLTAAGLDVVNGRLTVGQLLAALGYAGLGMALVHVAPQLASLARARAGAARIAEVLDVPVPCEGRRRLRAGPGTLELRGITVHGQDGTPALHDITLTVPAGAVVAVVGRSGSGKSTLAAVAGRLIDADAGEVRLDRTVLGRLRPGELRNAIGYAFERPVLLGVTVAEAISYGLDLPGSGGRASVEAAAAAVQVHNVISRLPGGYDTPLDQAPLSGGEAQRVGLARAIVREPRLLVLDDATSSLDTVTESLVATAISTALPGRTKLVVTHRASTATRADLVVWLERGRVRGLARHHELWHDPAYRAVFAQA
jgi:ATP-binding cassette subfamily B protein